MDALIVRHTNKEVKRTGRTHPVRSSATTWRQPPWEGNACAGTLLDVRSPPASETHNDPDHQSGHAAGRRHPPLHGSPKRPRPTRGPPPRAPPPLERRAEPASRRPSNGHTLLAERGGVAVASLALTSGAVAADPFVPTADAVGLLRER